MIEAVVFDLDGVLIESEQIWDDVRERLARERDGRWTDHASHDMMGMSSLEWSRYMHDVVGLADSPDEISREVVRRMLDRYSDGPPLIPGAVETVKHMAGKWPLAVASSSNRELIDRVLDVSGLAPYFRATVSSEEVERGKPSPDVFLEAARRLAVDASVCAAVEDSASGIESAHAAGMFVVAIPNRAFPPPADALDLAGVVLDSVAELSPERLLSATRDSSRPAP